MTHNKTQYNKQQQQQNNITYLQQKITKYKYTQNTNNINNNNTTTHTKQIQTKKQITNNKITINKNNHKSTKYITYAKWNCQRILLTNDNEQSDKLLEMEDYMNSNKEDVMVVNEADIHGKNIQG